MRADRKDIHSAIDMTIAMGSWVPSPISPTSTVISAPDRSWIDPASPEAAPACSGCSDTTRAVAFGITSPFGGTKQSGLGRRNGDEGFTEYLEIKTIGHPA